MEEEEMMWRRRREESWKRVLNDGEGFSGIYSFVRVNATIV